MIKMLEDIVVFKVEEKPKYTLVTFELKRNLEPSDLTLISRVIPDVHSRKGVVISGRGPIWLYTFLAHHYHYVKFIAVHDPRIGYIVTESHTPDVKVGEILTEE
jgi:CRISPR-associated protein Csx3